MGWFLIRTHKKKLQSEGRMYKGRIKGQRHGAFLVVYTTLSFPVFRLIPQKKYVCVSLSYSPSSVFSLPPSPPSRFHTIPPPPKIQDQG